MQGGGGAGSVARKVHPNIIERLAKLFLKLLSNLNPVNLSFVSHLPSSSSQHSYTSVTSQLLLFSSIPLLILHKPWRGKLPSRDQLQAVTLNAVCMATSCCLWVAALASLGPSRVLVLERVEVALHAALSPGAR